MTYFCLPDSAQDLTTRIDKIIRDNLFCVRLYPYSIYCMKNTNYHDFASIYQESVLQALAKYCEMFGIGPGGDTDYFGHWSC